MEGVAQDNLKLVSHSLTRGEVPPQITAAVASASETAQDKGPVPLSFPSILRYPGLTTRYAHLVESTRSPSAPSPIQSKKVWRRNDNEGKRWVRRRENARFTDNPHIAAPSKRDLELSPPVLHTTFPIPLPPYLPRSEPLPAAIPPAPDAKASNAGQFSLSLRGMRKALRRSGPRTQALVRGIEDELMLWLGEVVVVLNPGGEPQACQFPGRAIAGEEGIREVERSPQRLVWWIENDAWARYVVHCCARYHNIVSFSKDTTTHRLTHILRPNATRSDPATRTALATPPSTDVDLSSLSLDDDSDVPSALSDVQSIDGGSDVLSELDFASDDAESAPRSQRRVTASLSEIASDVDADVEIGSAVGDGGGDSDLEQVTEVVPLTIDDETPRPPLRARAAVWDRHHRARPGSSPSRSPARIGRMPSRPSSRAMATAKKLVNCDRDGRVSFYDYLFK